MLTHISLKIENYIRDEFTHTVTINGVIIQLLRIENNKIVDLHTSSLYTLLNFIFYICLYRHSCFIERSRNIVTILLHPTIVIDDINTGYTVDDLKNPDVFLKFLKSVNLLGFLWEGGYASVSICECA